MEIKRSGETVEKNEGIEEKRRSCICLIVLRLCDALDAAHFSDTRFRSFRNADRRSICRI